MTDRAPRSDPRASRATLDRMRSLLLTLAVAFLAVGAAAAQPVRQGAPLSEDERRLQQVAYDGDVETARRIVESGVRVDARDPEDHTALMWAAFNGHTAVVRTLLDAGAAVEARDVFGRTSLMYASSGPNHETVRLLLDRGATIDLQDKEERFSALMFAASEGQDKVVRVLLEHGADATLLDADGDTALSFATQNGHRTVVEILTVPPTPAR